MDPDFVAFGPPVLVDVECHWPGSLFEFTRRGIAPNSYRTKSSLELERQVAPVGQALRVVPAVRMPLEELREPGGLGLRAHHE